MQGIVYAPDTGNERGGIGTQDSHTLEFVLFQIVSQSSCSVSCFLIAPSENLFVCSDMIYSWCLPSLFVKEEGTGDVQRARTSGSMAAARGRKNVGES